jgi:hypothetical protein
MNQFKNYEGSSINVLLETLESVKTNFPVDCNKPTTIVVGNKGIYLVGKDGLSVCIATNKA